MSDHDPLNMGEVNASESETILTKNRDFAHGGNTIAFHVICQDRVGVQGMASVAWRRHLPSPFGQGVVGILGDGDPQDLLDAGVVGWSVDGNLGVYGNAGVTDHGIGVLGVSGVSNGGGGSETSPAGVGGRGRSSLGVHGVSESGDGVRGDSATGVGVVGASPAVIGVSGLQGAGPDLRSHATTDLGGAGVAGSADQGVGVLGRSNLGSGVRGESGADFGVVGVGPAGVRGVSTAGDTDGIGVVGVQGLAPDPRATSVVAGIAGASVDAPGVVGQSSASSGVRGESVTGNGVFGISPNGEGVFGASTTGTGIFGGSSTGIGVVGTTSDGPAGVIGGSNSATPGVRGESVQGIGIVGTTEQGPAGIQGTSTDSYGVIGVHGAGPDLSPSGPAGVGGSSDDTPGVLGNSARGIGVFGLHGTGHDLTPFSQAGVVGSSVDTPGVLGRSSSDAGVRGESGSGVAIHGISTGASGVAGQFDGNLVVNGDLSVTGLKSAMVPGTDGSLRRLYAVESPESWFEDFGTAQLEEGHAQVPLDTGYAGLIRGDDYRVFLTPLGDCKGLYVGARGHQGFDVHELQGGTSSVEFDYRVVAKRADITAPRLACA